MQIRWDIPFNLFGWSIAIFLLFAAIQAIVVTTLTMTGFAPSPMIALFTWFSVCGAIAYSLISRYRAALPHLLVVQGIACFYMAAITFATVLRNEPDSITQLVVTVLIASAGLFLCGTLGVTLAKALKDRSAR